MGCLLSTPEFYHPDLLAVLTEHKGDRAKPWHITPLLKLAPQPWQSKRPRDLDWSRNSPVANELVDTLNGALEDMGGGWPFCETYSCGFPRRFPVATPPQMVEAFKKVCQQVNEAKLFNMGLQCRAGIYKINELRDYGCGQIDILDVLCVLVEKRNDEKLRNVEALDTLEYMELLEKWAPPMREGRDAIAVVKGWSPPANWMARFSPKFSQICDTQS